MTRWSVAMFSCLFYTTLKVTWCTCSTQLEYIAVSQCIWTCKCGQGDLLKFEPSTRMGHLSQVTLSRTSFVDVRLAGYSISKAVDQWGFLRTTTKAWRQRSEEENKKKNIWVAEHFGKTGSSNPKNSWSQLLSAEHHVWMHNTGLKPKNCRWSV